MLGWGQKPKIKIKIEQRVQTVAKWFVRAERGTGSKLKELNLPVLSASADGKRDDASLSIAAQTIKKNLINGGWENVRVIKVQPDLVQQMPDVD